MGVAFAKVLHGAAKVHSEPFNLEAKPKGETGQEGGNGADEGVDDGDDEP